jgi:type IV fimbrial biogenesis protein FimT
MEKNRNMVKHKHLPCLSEGYSLIELMVCLLIVSILGFYAIPTFNSVLLKRQLENRVNYLMMSFKEAKLAAIKFDKQVIICRIGKVRERCLVEKSKGVQQWGRGWLVFVDGNLDKQYQEEEQLLKVVNLNLASCSVTWNRGEYLSFYQFGILKGSRAGTFKVSCAQFTTQLIVNWVGRVRRRDGV